MEQSTKAYEPGTVAVATVRGVKGVRVMRLWDGDWAADRDLPSGTADDGFIQKDIAGDAYVTDVRPLVVIDLGDYDNRAVTYLRNIARDDRAYDGGLTPRAKLVNLIADQIEAQTKPPRIPEPGPYGIVSGRIGEGGRPWKFARSEYGWVCLDDGSVWAWDSIENPTLIREGVES